MSKKRIVVAGGTGFLGSRICKSAVARGWEVTSLSRSGEPHWPSITSSPDPPPWSKSVQWAKADLLNPSSYTPYLESATAVVHSMGILLEADYKGVLTGRESPISGLRRAFAASRPGSSANPLDREHPDEHLTKSSSSDGNQLKPENSPLTYELMNRDSAIALARSTSTSSPTATFVYISAAAGAPLLPSRYLSTKRDAESTISTSFPRLRSIFVRPAFLYDSSRLFTLPIAAAGTVGSIVNQGVFGGRLTGWGLGAAVERPMKADDVAEAVVEAVENEEIRGVVTGNEIERLKEKRWRRGML